MKAKIPITPITSCRPVAARRQETKTFEQSFREKRKRLMKDEGLSLEEASERATAELFTYVDPRVAIAQEQVNAVGLESATSAVKRIMKERENISLELAQRLALEARAQRVGAGVDPPRQLIESPLETAKKLMRSRNLSYLDASNEAVRVREEARVTLATPRSIDEVIADWENTREELRPTPPQSWPELAVQRFEQLRHEISNVLMETGRASTREAADRGAFGLIEATRNGRRSATEVNAALEELVAALRKRR